MFPGDLPALLRFAVHNLLLASVFGGLALRTGLARGAWGRIAGWLALLLALPELVVAGASGSVSGLSQALVFTLIPAVVVFVVAQQRAGFGAEDNARNLLLPALAGVAGAALVLPFTTPSSVYGNLWLAGLVVSAVLAGVAAVRLFTLLQGIGLWSAAAVATGVAALGAGLLETPQAHGLSVLNARAWAVEAALALLADGPLIALTVWLLREVPPIRFSARYSLVLLVTILESAVLLRPTLSWTLAAGLMLMAASAWALLRADSEGSISAASLSESAPGDTL